MVNRDEVIITQDTQTEMLKMNAGELQATITCHSL